jgi:drug/metabolite transporter (DMT)-like permease
MRLENKGLLIVTTGVVLMSLDAVFIRLSGLKGFNPSFLFGCFSLISMSLLTQVRDHGLFHQLKAAGIISILSGMIMGVSGTSFVLAVQYTSVANVLLIMSLSPFFSSFFSFILLKENTDMITKIAMITSLLGMIIIVQGSLEKGFLGNLIAILAALASSLNYVIWRRYPKISRSLIIALGGLFIALFSSPFTHINRMNLHGLLIMAIMGLLTAPLGRTLVATSARYITAMEISLIGRLNVIIAPIIIWLLFSEVPSISSFIGGGIILTTVIVHSYLKITKTKRILDDKASGRN